MSLSNLDIKNLQPCKKFFEWSGSKGKIKCYNKDTKEVTFNELPFKFIKLDVLFTFAGFSDPDESGFWSNEVRSIKMEPFVVRTKNGIKKEGLWSEIGEGLKAQGAKFANSVYIAFFNDDNKLELANLKMYGSSIGAWIEIKDADKKANGFVISSSDKAKKGTNVYYTPVFEVFEPTDNELDEAKNLDRELQIYLENYFDYNNKESKAVVVSVGSTEPLVINKEDSNDDDVPF